MADDLDEALGLIHMLKALPALRKSKGPEVIWRALKFAGYAVSDPRAPASPGQGWDFEFTAVLDGAHERVGVEINSGPHLSGQSFYRADRTREEQGFDRVLLVVLGQVSKLARDRAFEQRTLKVDLLDPTDLASWLRRHAIVATDRGKSVVTLIRNCMKDIALRVARNPEELDDVEWRDLERLLREVFEGLGFDTLLTASSKDGGFDLRLEAGEEVFLVEVKHWKQAVGPGVVNGFLKVSAREEAKASLLLASGGFTGALFEGILEVGPPLHLGGRDKIIGLCRVFYRLGTELLQPDGELPALLLQDTVLAPPVIALVET
jgi:hypothetical protein